MLPSAHVGSAHANDNSLPSCHVAIRVRYAIEAIGTGIYRVVAVDETGRTLAEMNSCCGRAQAKMLVSEIADCKTCAEQALTGNGGAPHHGSPRCTSGRRSLAAHGGNSHCTCPTCY